MSGRCIRREIEVFSLSDGVKKRSTIAELALIKRAD